MDVSYFYVILQLFFSFLFYLLCSIFFFFFFFSSRRRHTRCGRDWSSDVSSSDLSTQAPEEFQPLVWQLNQLLDHLDQRLERSREALANLSHSVKTPIAALRQILEDTHRPLDTKLRHEMATRLADLDKQLEAEMRRSRFAGPQIGKSAYPIRQARDLLWMLGRIYTD